MKFPEPIPVKTIAKIIGAELIGNENNLASGINEIHKVERGDITFSDLKKYFKKSLDSEATIIILNENAECPPGKTLLIVDNPFEAYNNLVTAYRPLKVFTMKIPESSSVDISTILEPGVIIGHHVAIGKNCHIRANVVIGNHTQIGDNVVIESNAVIGSDAFYFKKHPDHYEKWTTGGKVIIEDDVFIGAATTIAKGVSGDTIIGSGSKLDCQIHIGHGAVIGKNCLLAAQVGVGGKTIIEDNVVLYGQVGLAQNIVIGKGAVVSAKSGVSKSLAAGKAYFGIPADEIRNKQRELAALRQLPEFMRKHK